MDTVMKANLQHAKELFEEGYFLCKLHENQKRPIGNAWNKSYVTKFDDSLTGYGLPLAINGRCSIDPDNVEKADKAIEALKGNPITMLLSKGVRTVSTRPDSGGRSMFKDPGGLRWIVFSTKESGIILELRASSPNLQDVIPGLVYFDKYGNGPFTQEYANSKTYMDAPELPLSMIAWWRKMSEDIEYRRSQQLAFAEALGETANISMGEQGDPLAFKPTTRGIREWFNEHHDVESILLEHGYTESDGRFAHPGATGLPGCSAIPEKDDLWYSHNGGDPLHGCFDAWAAHVVLNHQGDLERAEESVLVAFEEHAEKAIIDAFPDIDPEDLAEWDEAQAAKKAEHEAQKDRKRVPDASDLVATLYDLEQAKLTPRCIVENYLYADVAQLVAPGGVGKTTIILYEMICIALGHPVWGHEVVSAGRTLLVTAEDDRGMLLARMGKIMEGMGLTNEEKLKVLESALIWDATENGRKLVAMQPGTGMMAVSKLAHEIAERYRDAGFQMVTFDPTVSFGASEARVNDNEQQLVMAARTIKRALDCCVRYIHHTGKLNAKEKALDQYAGRNGTALPDGTRMTSVMHPVSPGERVKDDRGNWIELPVEFVRDNPDAGFTVMTQPKLSYSSAQPPMWIARNGWTYESVPEKRKTGSEIARDKEEAIRIFLLDQLVHGVTHTISSAETQINAIEGVTKKELRDLVKMMKARGLLIEEPLPSHMRKGSKATYLRPAEYGGVALPGDDNWPEPLD